MRNALAYNQLYSKLPRRTECNTTHTGTQTRYNNRLYKYWLVPRSTLKSYVPQLCNVTLGPRLTVNIWFVISRKTGKNYHYLTGIFKLVGLIHTLSTYRETRVPIFCQRLYYFRILKFFKVCKRQNKTTFKTFLWRNDSDVNAYEVNKRSAEYIFDLLNIAFGPKISRECMGWRPAGHVPR